MAFTVNLYNFTKKENSTARPSGGGAAFSCIVRTETGIINPTIELDLGLNNSPSSYNYAYIPEFQRYYFIEEWIFGDRLWMARLSVDVLATFKPQIGAASLYALRAANDWDGRIIDNKYPTKIESTYARDIKAIPYQTNTENGVFVLGVVSQYPRYGSIDYIICDATAMRSIVAGLVNDVVTDLNNFGNFDELSQELQLNLIDPLQYIKSCIYLPYTMADCPGEIGSSPITIYKYEISTSGTYKTLRGLTYIEKPFSFDLTKHPQTLTRGNFVNCAPYTDIQLSFPPFGIVQVDTTITCDATEITGYIRIDVPTGRAILSVYCNQKLLSKMESNLGVNVTLSQISKDYFGAAMSMAQGTASAIGSALSGDIAGAIGGGIGAIGNAYQSMIPKSSSIGSGGSYAQYLEHPRLDIQFFEIVDDDITQNGRPLCQMVTPSTLGGYMLIQDGDVPLPGTATEARQVKAFLEGGFYFE